MKRPRRMIQFGITLATATALVGCGSGPSSSRQPALYDKPKPPQAATDPRTRQAEPDAAGQALDDAQVQQLLARLEALEHRNASLQRTVDQQRSDAFMEQVRQRNAQRGTGAQANQSADSQQPGPAAEADSAGTQPGATANGGATEQTREQLLDALVSKIMEGKDPARTKALLAAMLSVAGDNEELDHAMLDQLDPRSREKVARFHQMVAVAFDELAGDDKRTLTRREMIEQIDHVFGAQPLTIETLELCRRVDSYGVYEPFVGTRFLAGRKNRVLVYVELENFHHEPTDDGRYEVRLEQQIELYDATGETTVWRQGPVELKDVSRKQRRDFFIVYPVDLPARLTAGGYRLKVRVADKHTGSICEKTLHNIQVVADRALVQRQE